MRPVPCNNWLPSAISSPILGCSTTNVKLAIAVGRVNGMMASWGYMAPFGGPKQTGGGRTNGKQGLDEYLTVKTISIKLAEE